MGVPILGQAFFSTAATLTALTPLRVGKLGLVFGVEICVPGSWDFSAMQRHASRMYVCKSTHESGFGKTWEWGLSRSRRVRVSAPLQSVPVPRRAAGQSLGNTRHEERVLLDRTNESIGRYYVLLLCFVGRIADRQGTSVARNGGPSRTVQSSPKWKKTRR